MAHAPKKRATGRTEKAAEKYQRHIDEQDTTIIIVVITIIIIIIEKPYLQPNPVYRNKLALYFHRTTVMGITRGEKISTS